MSKKQTEMFQSKGWKGNPGSFVTWWRRTHFENSMIDALLHREHTPYREIGHGAVSYTMDRAGIPYTEDEVRILMLHGVLHLLGMDHKRLTYYFNGRNMRLTDVYGELIPQIVA